MFDLDRKTNPWVCPSDRQLALRAKLKTGWSIKTRPLLPTLGSIPSPPSGEYNGEPRNPLSPSEQELIKAVVKRAEALDQNEQLRVGRLVDRLENMKRHALGNGTSQCILCGERFGILSHKSKSLICRDCHKAVCSKCGIETISSTNGETISLCKICSETREIWKKSGAWFFKGLPKYILPPRNSSSISSGRRRGTLEKTAAVADSEIPNNDKGSETPERRLATEKYNFTNRMQADIEEETTSSDEEFFKRHKKPDKIIEQKSINLPPVSSSKQQQFQQKRSSLSSLPSSGGISQSEGQSLVSSNSIEPANYLGTIELSLVFDRHLGALHITIHRAKNLKPMDINGLSDPFCKILLLPVEDKENCFRTKTVHKTRNPEYNETFSFYNILEQDLNSKVICFLIHDDDQFGQDFMGEARLELSQIALPASVQISLEEHYPYSVPQEEQHFWQTCSSFVDRGQILLALSYNSHRRALIVAVMRCVNLVSMDANGFSDPFVKLRVIKPDLLQRRPVKTSIKWKTLNPVFNEEFAFEARMTDLSKLILEVTVWDKDYGKPNDYLGGLQLGWQSKGERLRHWIDLIKLPDQRHEAWHLLADTPPLENNLHWN